LEHLVAFGCALGSALDSAAIRQVFWRYVPTFAHHRELWMMTTRPGGWDTVVRDATVPSPRSIDVLEGIAAAALDSRAKPGSVGAGVGQDICFPMLVNETAVGVVGVRNDPPLATAERQAIAAAVALLAIAIRNVELLASTRANSVRDPLTGCFNRSYGLEA